MLPSTYHHRLFLPRVIALAIAWWGVVCISSTLLSQAPGLPLKSSPDQELSHPLRFFTPGESSGTRPAATRTPEPSSTVGQQVLSLRKPSRERNSNSEQLPASARVSTRAMTTVVSALSIVLAAFFLVVWLTRSANKRRWSPLPTEAVQVLGRAPLAGRQWMQLVQVGNKLVMLSVNANQVDTITEITDSKEVERLVALCHKEQPNHLRETFQQVLDQYSKNRVETDPLPPFDHKEASFLTRTG
ncbi:MAG: flagellar biosynthetic protein FliO [Pirellulaceae bacterium]